MTVNYKKEDLQELAYPSGCDSRRARRFAGLWRSLKRATHWLAARLVAMILRPGALRDPRNFRLWERQGYHIVPLHFYYPIPDTRELSAKAWHDSQLVGIDMRPAAQLRFLHDISAKYAGEYGAFPIEPNGSGRFHVDNDAFNGIDPYVYYCFIRHFRPQTIIEVGSGYSTLLGARACRLNGKTRYLCIDPWPRQLIEEAAHDVELVRSRAEDMDVRLFEQLRANDVLFVDSSHVVRTAGEVCYIILEVLPRLAEGVLVHFHDIFLPADYPKEWVAEKQLFWTEQYLLHAYLADNAHTRVIFASHYMASTYPDQVRQSFPDSPWVGGASFWIQKC
jgi:hypothetical protein